MAKQASNNTPVQVGRVMPSAIDVEQCVLGALMLESVAYADHKHRLSKGLFYEQKHQAIYRAIARCAKNGIGIDMVTVMQAVQDLGEFTNDEAAEPTKVSAYYISILTQRVGSAAHLQYWISILEEKAYRRDIIERTSKVASAAYEESAEYGEELTTLREYMSDHTTSNKLIDILQDPTNTNFEGEMKDVPSGISVNYAFDGNGEKNKKLVLPGGALTFVCAPTSHGKSTFLRNLALDLAMQPEQGRVLYFSFEESKQDLWAKFLNLYIGRERSRKGLTGELHKQSVRYNNDKSIKRYFREGAAAMEKWTEDAKHFFPGYLNAFKQTVICLNEPNNTGKLKVIQKDLDMTELVEAIEYYSRSMEQRGEKVKAIFIDYVQLLTVRDTKKSRKEELKEVSTELMHLSVKMGIPFVLAAQLTRETKSPLMLFNQNISDASDIEKAANLIICLWDSEQAAQDPNYYFIGGGSSNKEGQGTGKKNPDTIKLENRGFFAGGAMKYEGVQAFESLPEEQKHTVYAKITKYRGEQIPQDAIFKWHKNTGYIVENYTDEASAGTAQDNGLPFPPEDKCNTLDF